MNLFGPTIGVPQQAEGKHTYNPTKIHQKTNWKMNTATEVKHHQPLRQNFTEHE